MNPLDPPGPCHQVSVSAINRNDKGRSGPGKLDLASPLTVAASAVTGDLLDPPFAGGAILIDPNGTLRIPGQTTYVFTRTGGEGAPGRR